MPARILGFGVLYGEKHPDGTTRSKGWLRTGKREVHGINTYPSLDDALTAIMTDPRYGRRSYTITLERAYF